MDLNILNYFQKFKKHPGNSFWNIFWFFADKADSADLHKTENVDLDIRPKVHVCISDRICRSAHQTESADLHFRPTVQICISDRRCRSAHRAESADLHIRPKM